MKRFLSLILAVMMAFSMLPVSAFAEGEEPADEGFEAVTEEKQETLKEEKKEEPKAEPVEEKASEEPVTEKKDDEPAQEPSEQPKEKVEEAPANQPKEELSEVSEEEPAEVIEAEPKAGPAEEEPEEPEEELAEAPEEEETEEQEESQPVTITVKTLKDAEITAGSATFTVKAEASDGSRLIYQWQQLDCSVNYKNDAEREAAWTDIDNETEATLELKDITKESYELEYAKLVFRCVLTAQDGTVAYTEEVKLIADTAWEEQLIDNSNTKENVCMPEEEKGDCLFTDVETNLTLSSKTEPIVIGQGFCGEEATWILSDDGVLLIGGSGAIKDYSATEVKPWTEYLDKINVISIENGISGIGEWAFASCSLVTSVFFPDTLKTIGSYAFYECSSIQNINIPSGITTIKQATFYECAALESISLPASLLSIEHAAFGYCQELKSIQLPDNLTSIGNCAFTACSSLTKICLPQSLQKIEPGAFCDCDLLKNVIIPKGVTELGFNAFTGLDYVMVEEGNSRYHSLDNCVIETNTSTLVIGSNHGIIPYYTATIGCAAFYHCAEIKEITIPSSVQTIESIAFDGCTALSAVYYPDKQSKKEQISISAERNLPLSQAKWYYWETLSSGQTFELQWKLECWTDSFEGTLTISGRGRMMTYGPQNPTVSVAPWCQYWRQWIKTIKIGEGVTEVGAYAFKDCEWVENVTLPSTLTGIDNYAFYNCKALKSVSLPDNLVSLGDYAFCCCSEITKITIPSDLYIIGDSAFSYCENIDSIAVAGTNSKYYADGNCLIERSSKTLILGCCNSIIPTDVGIIGQNAFSGCQKLDHISLPNSVKRIEGAAFNGCSGLTSVQLSSSLNYIGLDAFANCISLMDIEIPESVSEIAERAFESCKALKSITIPSSVSKLGEYAFLYCTGLEDISLLYTESEIKQGVFLGCDSLKKVKIPDSITVICEQAFYECERLQSIVLPDGIEKIENYAFYNCISLSDVYYAGTLDTREEIIDYGNNDPLFLANWHYRTETGHYSAFVEEKKPTCENEGHISCWQCIECKKLFLDEECTKELSQDDYIQSKLPHNPITKENEVYRAPTCTEVGYTAGSHCSECGVQLVEQEEIKALGHQLVHYNRVEPLYGVPGNIEYWYCSRTGCGKYYKDQACTIETDAQGIILPARDYYFINYVLFGGTNNAKNPNKYLPGSQYTLRVPTRSGYTFAGWYTDEACTAYSIAPEITKNTKGDLTFYAKWASTAYKVAFNANGGNGKMAAMTAVPYDTAWPLTMNAFTKKGYDFIGWALTADGSSGIVAEDGGTVLNLTDTPDATVTLYAQWKLATYTIQYELFGGINNTANPQSYTIISDTFMLQNPIGAPAGSTFAGWYKDAAFKKKVTQIKKGSTGDMRLYAKWNAQSYTLTYMLNGGTNPKTTVKAYTIASPDIELPVPTRKGYEFRGWYGNEFFEGEPIAVISTGTIGNRTLYAKWALAEYTIGYVLAVGENATENPVNYTIESGAITLQAPTLPEGVSFGCWCTDAALKKKITTIKAGAVGDMTLYAKLIGTQYKITYYLNGGTNDKTNPKTYMSKIGSVALKPATRKGYTFLGWYADASFGGEPLTMIGETAEGALSLYARWELATYSIDYVLNGGRAVEENPGSYNIGTASFTPAAPERRGCTFAGWYSDAACKKKVSQIKKGTVGDITLYAKWTENSYKVAFNVNGGKGKMKVVTQKYGYLYKLPICTITNAGYIFAGWNTKQDGTGADYDDGAYVYNLSSVSGTITLYAQWKKAN